MSKIFQRFDLDLDKIMSPDSPTIDLTSAGRALRSELSGKGYGVFESNTMIGGVPQSVILVYDEKMPCKDDFYEVTGRFNLPYASEACYFSHSDGSA